MAARGQIESHLERPSPSYLVVSHSHSPQTCHNLSTSALSVSPSPHALQIQDDVRDQPGIFKSFINFFTSFNFRPAIRVRSPSLRPLPPQLQKSTFTLSQINIFIPKLAPKIYHTLFLLYLPRLYSSRAQPLLTEIVRIAEEHRRTHERPSQPDPNSTVFPTTNSIYPTLDCASPVCPVVLPGQAWEVFRGSIISDWKLLIGVAAALLTALGYAVFQLSSVIVDPATRTAAFVSIASAFMSATCAIVFTIHFRAAPAVLGGKTAERFVQAERCPYAWFNLWVLLALPLVWTAWSTISITIFALLFLWNTHPSAEPPHPDIGISANFITPIAVTGVLSAGSVYLILALQVLRSW